MRQVHASILGARPERNALLGTLGSPDALLPVINVEERGLAELEPFFFMVEGALAHGAEPGSEFHF